VSSTNAEHRGGQGADRGVEAQRCGAVATVWLNRPQVRNSFDATAIAAIHEVFVALGADADVRVVVLAGRGAAFCAGADLNWMKVSSSYSQEQNHADAVKLARMLEAVSTCPKPVIAKVHGDAYGGGFGLIAAADMAIATADARFALTEVRFGLVPAAIGPYVLAAIGTRAASRYMLTGERMTAVEAHRLGLVHEIVTPEQLDGAVQRLVDKLLLGGPEAIAASKRLIREISGRTVDAALIADTAARIAAARASLEGREGVEAFLNKRKPAWIR